MCHGPQPKERLYHRNVKGRKWLLVLGRGMFSSWSPFVSKLYITMLFSAGPDGVAQVHMEVLQSKSPHTSKAEHHTDHDSSTWGSQAAAIDWQHLLCMIWLFQGEKDWTKDPCEHWWATEETSYLRRQRSTTVECIAQTPLRLIDVSSWVLAARKPQRTTWLVRGIISCSCLHDAPRGHVWADVEQLHRISCKNNKGMYMVG